MRSMRVLGWLMHVLLVAVACVPAGTAIAQSGGLAQWGGTGNFQGQNQPALAGPYIAIAAGDSHSVALRADGSLVQWGNSFAGQTQNQPALAGPYMAIAAGGQQSLALRRDGSLVQWGVVDSSNAPNFAGPFGVIAAGFWHALALRPDGSLVQWGRSIEGQTNNVPPAAGPYVAIAAGFSHNLALRADGSLVQWGDTSRGQANNAPPAAGPYIAIAAGLNHSLALRADGSLVQWGATNEGQAANQPSSAGPFIAIAAGWNHNLALREDGSIVQWGATNAFQLQNQPVLAGPFVAIAGGFAHSVALRGTPPVNATFTYQGRLAGQTGPVDLRFRIYDVLTGGNPVGATTLVNGLTPDAQGVFTAQVQPGIVDLSRPLWLEIGVASAGSGSFTTLAPRQQLGAAPIAAYATRAGSANGANVANSAASAPWSGITGVPANIANAFSPWAAGANNSINFTAGSVGIGTSSPNFVFEVRSNSDTQIGITGGPAGRSWTLQSSASTYGAGSQLNGSFQIIDRTVGAARMLIDGNGNVGIGVTAPTQRLHVAGNVLANNVAVPSSGRFKHNIAPIDDALGKLLKLDGVTFDWNPDFAKDRPGREHDIGFVAEDVARVFPEVVFRDQLGHVTGMDYSRLTAVAIAAIKQQQARFDAELAKRDAENAALKARLERLERAIDAASAARK